MEHFTPVSASIGGVLIGLSATMLWLANGRIAGISGIVGGLWTARTGDVAWRIAFAIGLIAAPVLYGMAGGELPHLTVSVPWPLIMIGGLLVGFGTRLGGGCTSGHGVCGIARFSRRSLVATGLFMATAIVAGPPLDSLPQVNAAGTSNSTNVRLTRQKSWLFQWLVVPVVSHR